MYVGRGTGLLVSPFGSILQASKLALTLVPSGIIILIAFCKPGGNPLTKCHEPSTTDVAWNAVC